MAVKKKNTVKSEQIKDTSKELVLIPQDDMLKPERDTKFAHESAKILKDIVQQNNWVKHFGGQSSHLMYEGWQTLGKYYGYTVKTHDAEPIAIGDVEGFKAKATVVNENTGVEVGSAEAFCLRDEGNWRSKPAFQLASMAQTRAGSKALRQILGFVVALAGYNPTPAEEMDGVHQPTALQTSTIASPKTNLITEKQRHLIFQLVEDKGKSKDELDDFIWRATSKGSVNDLTAKEAGAVIERLMKEPDVKKNKEVTAAENEEIDLDEAAKAVEEQMLN